MGLAEGDRAEHLRGEWIELPQALLYYEPEFLTAADSAALFRQLVDAVPWRQDRLRLYGREVPMPRLSAWYGDAGAVYSYSGLRLEPLPWLEALEQLRQRLQRHLSRRFNAVLLNYYRNGTDSMGSHSDDEPELGPAPVIATVSLGAPRRFALTPRGVASGGAAWRRDLADGSLLVMAGPCQRHWRHALPKTRRPVAGRISLTYRLVRPVSEWTKL
jgi:alkylated DNA repair dioxygenase AlkB